MQTIETISRQTAKKSPVPNDLDKVREMLKGCIQCGTCSASCPNAFAMDLTPRRLWRLVLFDRLNEILAGQSFALCSNCYMCTLRCPRGLELTAVMATLKRIAFKACPPHLKPSYHFYRQFVQNVRQYGRVREMELMSRYFLALKNPIVPFRFTPLGFRLIRKGKVHITPPSFGKAKYAHLFNRINELEPKS